MLSLIVVLVVVGGLAEVLKGFREIRAVIAPVAQSWWGILITIAVTAWVTFRCCHAKQRYGK